MADFYTHAGGKCLLCLGPAYNNYGPLLRLFVCSEMIWFNLDSQRAIHFNERLTLLIHLTFIFTLALQSELRYFQLLWPFFHQPNLAAQLVGEYSAAAFTRQIHISAQSV